MNTGIRFLGGFPILDPDHPLKRWEPERPKIQVLVYTDNENMNFDDSADTPAGFGLKLMRDLILEQQPPTHLVDLDLRCRKVVGNDATNKLTSDLLSRYDEVWFFPTTHQGSKGYELTPSEVAALRDWMKTGGVLITGDHSNPCDPNFGEIVVPLSTVFQPLCNLGKLIGQHVPRARELRAWDGPPPQDPPGNYNTQVPGPQIAFRGVVAETPFLPQGVESLELQEDSVPQTLLLVPNAEGRIHPLLHTRDGVVHAFPDHMHEGHIRIPSTLGSDWPTVDGFQAAPRVIARGTDKRNGNVYDILAAYNGDPVEAGRIVADSTWHHYLNANLRGFEKNPDKSVLGEIALFYSNLVWWLAPLATRARLAESAVWVLTWNDSVREVVGNANQTVGKVAAELIGKYLNIGSIPEFVSWLLPNSIGRSSVDIPSSFYVEFLGFLVNRNMGRLVGRNQDTFPQIVRHAIDVASEQLINESKRKLAQAEILREQLTTYTRQDRTFNEPVTAQTLIREALSSTDVA